MAKQFKHINSDNREITTEATSKKSRKHKAVAPDGEEDAEVSTVPHKKRKGKVTQKQAPLKTMKKQKVKPNIFDDNEDNDKLSKQST